MKKIERNSVRMTTAGSLLAFLLYCTALVTIVALLYGYNSQALVVSAVAFCILLVVDAFLWRFQQRVSRAGYPGVSRQAIQIGMAIGLLWVIEISINNFIAPPLPARDTIDNLFWAAIAILIFMHALLCAYRANRFRSGLEAGFWSGSVSGALACGMALSMIVFGMHWITQDPLNITEWAARGAGVSAPGMAAYFAFETLAGALLHLVVLGTLMGLLLGGLAGLIGKVLRAANQQIQKIRKPGES